jgi:hypothetical protein
MTSKIIIEFTDNPNEIRNLGVGDYENLPNGGKIIKVYCQDSSNKWNQWAFICAMHELTEFFLCENDGVRETDIDKFDKWCCEQGVTIEFGDHEKAPYKSQHRSAEFIERYLAERLGLDWFEYMDNYVIPEDFKYNKGYGKS